jgi:hypothetical protein
MNQIEKLKHFFINHGFNVSTRIADKFGIRVGNVRLFFIYLSFATLGLSFILYLIVAFGIRIKDIFFQKRPSVFDL